MGVPLQAPPGDTQGHPSRCRVSVGAEVLFCRDGCSVAVDTGASYITGPAGPVSVLMKAIGATEVAEGEVSHRQPLAVSPLAACPLCQRCPLPSVRGGLRAGASAAQHLLPPGREGLRPRRPGLCPAGECPGES